MNFFLRWLTYFLICFTVGMGMFAFFSSKKASLLMPKKISQSSYLIDPDHSIKFSFDKPIRRGLIEESFKITPAVKGKLVWSENNLEFSFEPEEIMNEGEKYLIAFQGESDIFFPFAEKEEFFIEMAPKVTKVAPFKNQGVKTEDKIFINFDRSTKKYELDFLIDPLVDYTVSHNEEKTEFVLSPVKPLLSDTNYRVEVYQSFQSNKKGVKKEKIKEFSFSTLKPLQFISSYPKGGNKDVLINQKFTISFDRPVDTEIFWQYLEIVPEALYHIKFSANGKTIVIEPEKFQTDTPYKIIIKKGLKAQDGSYLEEDVGIEFVTGNLGGIIRDERRSTDDPLVKDGKFIDVNLSKQLMGIYNDGMLLGTYLISSGKRGMGTPTGNFKIFRKERKHWSREYKLWMPYSMQFTSAGHFIHELPEWPNGYKEGANHLGIPVSHGCVRLGVGPAETVFNFSDVGTPMYIHY